MTRGTLELLLQQRVLAGPDLPAITLRPSRGEDIQLTRAELLSGAAAAAGQMSVAGIAPGEVLILIQPPGRALVEWFLGAILYGAIPSVIPHLTEKLQPGIYRRSLKSLVQVTRPKAIAVHPDYMAEASAAVGGERAERILVLEVPERAASDASHQPSIASSTRSPQDIVLLQHSSGTTGLQKGVALSHQAVLRQIESYSEAIGLRDTDVIASWLPLYHDMGLIAGFLLPVLMGIPLVLLSPLDWVKSPARLFQAITRYGASLTWMPNFAYNFTAQKTRSRDLEGVDLSCLRAIINCSEPIQARSHQLFLERFRAYGMDEHKLATCYAMAENVFAVSQSNVGEPPQCHSVDRLAYMQSQSIRPPSKSGGCLWHVSSGRCLPNVEVRILDAAREDLPDQRMGEIAIRSDCMLTGYYRRPDLTAEAFHDGWYLTGDLGYTVDGELYVTGRKKDLIIVGGKNIYPHDLEALAAEVSGIHPGRVVAFGVYNDDRGTEEPVVVAEADETAAEVRGRLADAVRRSVTLGSDVALRYVEIVDRGWLIKTSSGKIARNANRARYLEELRGEGPPVNPDANRPQDPASTR